MFVRYEALRFLKLSLRGEWCSMNIGRANPDRAPSSSRGANVVVHLPTWAERIIFIGGADLIDEFTSNCVTKIGETVKWLERSNVAAKPPRRFGRISCDLVICITRVREHALFVPRVVG